MKSIFGFILWLLYLLPVLCFSQPNDIDFVVRKIALDYPGFRSKVTNASYRRIVQRAIKEYDNDTFRVISKIAYFFNDQHLRIVATNNWHLKDSLLCRKNRNRVITYLDKSPIKKMYEGYWLDDEHDCIIGLIQDKPDNYTAYVIEVSGGNLIPGQVKGTFKKISERNFYADSYITYSGRRVALAAFFRSDTLFTVGGSNKWRLLNEYIPSMLSVFPEPKEMVTGMQLSKNTYLLKIPGSSYENILQIDSLIKVDYDRITNSENLIVDVRNNAGGKSGIYLALLPLAYTYPYAAISSSIYCTEDGALQQEEIFKSYKKKGIDTAAQTAWIAYLKKMHDSVGKFIYHQPDTIKFDKILVRPQQVGIIINYGTQSAAEMLALMLRHSNKVTLFGENTIGAIDYLSFYSINCPSGKYQLYMPLSKRLIPSGEHSLDGIGISPDVRIGDNVPDWVKFVKDYYENN